METLVIHRLFTLRVMLSQNVLEPITRQQNFRLVQIQTNCRRHLKVHLKWKISTI